MWIYEKTLQYPVKIRKPDPAMAKLIITQLGGPDGELGASMRYLNQRFSMPYREVVGMLTDIGTEELAHMEMIGAIVTQLTRNLSVEEIKKSGFDAYFTDHTAGVYPVSAAGVPFDVKYIGVKGDAIADLNEDLAADAALAREQPFPWHAGRKTGGISRESCSVLTNSPVLCYHMNITIETGSDDGTGFCRG